MLFLRCILLGATLAAPTASLSLEPDKLFEKIAPSVVIVWSLDANARKAVQGSGVVIAPREIITNCHVIEKASSILIEQGGQTTKAQIRFTDRERDLCQLTMEPSHSIGVPIGGAISYKELKVGQRVYTVGAPEGLELSLGEGLISQLRGTDSVDLIQTTAQISHGSSGGGLFDTDGRLIGITTFNLKGGQSLNFAIPASWIFELSARYADREAIEIKKAADEARAAEEERILQNTDRRRREEAIRVTEQLEEASRLEQLRRFGFDSYKPKLTPRVITSYYDVSATDANELYREVFSNRGPSMNGRRFAAKTSWNVQWKFRHQKVSGRCEVKDVAVAIEVRHTFPKWLNIERAPSDYAARWQSYMDALKHFHTLYEKDGNMAADEIETKLRSMPPSPTCESLGEKVNETADEVIKKFQAQDEEISRITRYGEILGAKFPR